MSADTIYIIEMPAGQNPREITNINYNIVKQRIEALGGKIYPKPIEPKPQPKIITRNHIVNQRNETFDLSTIVNQDREKKSNRLTCVS